MNVLHAVLLYPTVFPYPTSYHCKGSSCMPLPLPTSFLEWQLPIVVHTLPVDFLWTCIRFSFPHEHCKLLLCPRIKQHLLPQWVHLHNVGKLRMVLHEIGHPTVDAISAGFRSRGMLEQPSIFGSCVCKLARDAAPTTMNNVNRKF